MPIAPPQLIPMIDSTLVNGLATDAEKVQDMIEQFGQVARTFLGDLTGAPVWFEGLRLSADADDSGALIGTVTPGVAWPWDDQGLPLRVRTPTQKRIELLVRKLQLVALQPNPADDGLAALVVEQSDLVDAGDLEIRVPIATVILDAENVILVEDARYNAFLGRATEANSQPIRLQSGYVDLADARVSLLVRDGDSVIVRLEADITGGQTNIQSDAGGAAVTGEDLVNTYGATQVVAYEGDQLQVSHPAAAQTIVGPASALPRETTTYAEWLITFPEGGGAKLLQMQATGKSGQFSNVKVVAKIIPRERQ